MTVLIQTNREIAFITADAELVSDRLTFIRQFLAQRLIYDLLLRSSRNNIGVLLATADRLVTLTTVPIDGDGFQPQLPSL
ncbi:hypothetical protein BMS3Bbin04_02120 [bacterium BMS3Bbin04]|nr:hypothetical protein BMS3Bbin04_02120 [bacterium BMS3Bbin04]